MLNASDKKLILDAIKTGNFTLLCNLQINSDKTYSIDELNNIYKGNDSLKRTYRLAEKISNPLIIKNSNLKKRITQLIASELNNCNNSKAVENIYTKLNNYVTNLVSFPEKKRVIKFLVKFTLMSKALQSVLQKSEKHEVLFIYKKICSEVNKNC